MMKRRNSYAADTVFPFAVFFINRSLGFAGTCNLTRMNVFYTKEVNRLLFAHTEVPWTMVGLASLQSETSKLKTFVQSSFAPHCSSGVFRLNSPLLNYAMQNLKRLKSLRFTDAAPFEYFSVL